jgi:hypothetical protein
VVGGGGVFNRGTIGVVCAGACTEPGAVVAAERGSFAGGVAPDGESRKITAVRPTKPVMTATTP